MPPDFLPQFLVVGHVLEDVLPDGSRRLGGAATYASLQALRLGLRVALLTTAPADFDLSPLAGVELHRIDSPVASSMRNVYEGGQRRQYLLQRGPVIRPEDVPAELAAAPVVLLGPIAGDVDPAVAERFPGSPVGLGVQGWLREAGPDGLIGPSPWRDVSLPPNATAIFVSDEDLPVTERRAALDDWAARVPVVACTRSQFGAEVCWRGERRSIPAFPARTVDPTGAGDVFAAAFLVRFRETEDAWLAARFAAAAASLAVEGEGYSAIPTRAQVEERLLPYR
ncbi:MAG TPA: PfkB family carbohydrate kinase [Dehalococcoidia bacterium]|nr:PfkB family carbohydrate kinase [Dehalococcoidia bacterium]